MPRSRACPCATHCALRTDAHPTASPAAGYNNVDLAAAGQHKLTVLRVPAYSPNAVAEHAVALMLALNRNLKKAIDRSRHGNFDLGGLVGRDIASTTVGVVGTGKIGLIFARILHGFGAKLLAFDVYKSPDAAALGVEYVGLDELLARRCARRFFLCGCVCARERQGGRREVGRARQTPPVVEPWRGWPPRSPGRSAWPPTRVTTPQRVTPHGPGRPRSSVHLRVTAARLRVRVCALPYTHTRGSHA